MKRSALFMVMLLVILLSGCQNSKTIPVGLCITITDSNGYSLQHGITIRNGFEMAVKEINEQGGINGRLIEPIILDDRDSIEVAKSNIDRLNERDVQLVIGFSTSKMMPAIDYAVENYDMLFISPSMSSPLFSGKDDRFLRLISSDVEEVKTMVELATDHLALKDMFIVYNNQNANYTVPYYEMFKEGVVAEGTIVNFVEEYASVHNVLESFVMEIEKRKPEGILIVANSGDAIEIVQEIKKRGLSTEIMVEGYSGLCVSSMH